MTLFYLYAASFLFGIIFMTLTTFQHTNSAHGRYIVAFPTSLALGACVWLNINFAVKKPHLYFIFCLGAAFGSSLGVYLGRKKEKPEKR